MPKLPSLADRIKPGMVKSNAKRSTPLWKGPEKDGITFSLLSRYLVDKERFRLLAVEGLAPAERFSRRLEYGNMWHVCEESLANVAPDDRPHFDDWKADLETYARGLCNRYPMDREDIEHWWMTCQAQFPEYVRHWSTHPDMTARHPLFSERVFNVPYALPSGRTVRLRGKWDSVDEVRGFAVLQENKTKGDVNEVLLRRQLSFDLQTMMYLVALYTWNWDDGTPRRISGVRYNVVRRPFSGGKGTISRSQGTQGAKCTRKSCREVPNPHCDNCHGRGRVGAKPPETAEAFYKRLVDDYIHKEPEYWFMRWNSEVSPGEVDKFRFECLDGILENLCDDWEWWSHCKANGVNPFNTNNTLGRPDHFRHWPRHFRYPYGVYNPLLEENQTELDDYLATGSELGLARKTNLFPELTEAA